MPLPSDHLLYSPTAWSVVPVVITDGRLTLQDGFPILPTLTSATNATNGEEVETATRTLLATDNLGNRTASITWECDLKHTQIVVKKRCHSISIKIGDMRSQSSITWLRSQTNQLKTANLFTYPPAHVAHGTLSARFPFFEAALIEITIHVRTSTHTVLFITCEE